MWHYIGKEEIAIKSKRDLRAGTYLVYDIVTFNNLIFNKEWVYQNNAYEEYDYILDYMHYRVESYDKKLIYIPDAKTAMKRETEEAIIEMETLDRIMSLEI